jgi:hypothetical protein
MSELLRKKQGDGQVSKQQDRQNQHDCGSEVDMHGVYLSFWQALT